MTVDGASLVCSVLSDARGLLVANLADHDDVGVLTQKGAKRGGECQADLLLHLDLTDARHLVFDGVFGGQDVVRGAVEVR